MKYLQIIFFILSLASCQSQTGQLKNNLIIDSTSFITRPIFEKFAKEKTIEYAKKYTDARISRAYSGFKIRTQIKDSLLKIIVDKDFSDLEKLKRLVCGQGKIHFYEANTTNSNKLGREFTGLDNSSIDSARIIKNQNNSLKIYLSKNYVTSFNKMLEKVNGNKIIITIDNEIVASLNFPSSIKLDQNAYEINDLDNMTALKLYEVFNSGIMPLHLVIISSEK